MKTIRSILYVLKLVWLVLSEARHQYKQGQREHMLFLSVIVSIATDLSTTWEKFRETNPEIQNLLMENDLQDKK